MVLSWWAQSAMATKERHQKCTLINWFIYKKHKFNCKRDEMWMAAKSVVWVNVWEMWCVGIGEKNNKGTKQSAWRVSPRGLRWPLLQVDSPTYQLHERAREEKTRHNQIGQSIYSTKICWRMMSYCTYLRFFLFCSSICNLSLIKKTKG